jgi:hypothetical protein
MKRNKKNYYPAISSFAEFRFEGERLDLKGKLLEAKIRMNIIQIKKELSSSGLGTSLINDLGLQGVAGFIKEILDRRGQ